VGLEAVDEVLLIGEFFDDLKFSLYRMEVVRLVQIDDLGDQ
jgi:hypothetical protein